MNIIFQAIGFILMGIFITYLFGKLRKIIIKKALITTKEKINGIKKNNKEKFDIKKFLKGMFSFNLVELAKDIHSWFNIRKICAYLLILSIFYGYGWYKGQMGKPIKVNLAYEKEFKMKIDSHYLVKPKNSQNMQIEDKNGTVIKTIRAEDMPDLAKKLRPYGFIFEPIGIAGYGVGTDNCGFEGGAGVSFIKYWKWRLETFLTNKGIYVGTSYQITDNSALGLGAGKGYKEGENRAIIYYKWRF